MINVPDTVAVVLPVRFPKSSTTDLAVKLKNDFSVAILDLPVKCGSISQVKVKCDELRKSADPLVRYILQS